MTRLMDLKKRLMEDPEFQKEYARVDEEFEVIEARVRARTAAKLMQAELAGGLGATESAVTPLERKGVDRSTAINAPWYKFMKSLSSKPKELEKRIMRLLNLAAAVVIAYVALVKLPEEFNDPPIYKSPPISSSESPPVEEPPESGQSPDSGESPIVLNQSSLRPLEVYASRVNNVNFTNTFSDPDGDAITLTAISEDKSVFTVGPINGFIVPLIGGSDPGESFVTVTASDPSGKSTWLSIRVIVKPLPP